MDELALTPERVLRRVEWRVLRRLDGRLQGDYRTVFRGQGVDVVHLREYQHGDDTRRIDWNVTARTDTLHVREYLEDREVTAWLVLDRSPSMGFGPADRRKGLVLAELAGAVAQVLSRGGNRVGAVLFDDTVQEVIPPGAGRTQVLRIMSRLLAGDAGPSGPPGAKAGTAGMPRGPRRRRRPWTLLTRRGGPHGAAVTARHTTSLEVPLRAMLGIARRRSVVVVVSDFISEPGWEPALGQLARRHDVVALQVVDPRELELPSVGSLWVEDAETGEQILVDADDAGFRARLAQLGRERQTALRAATGSAGVDLHTVSTDEDLVRALLRVAERRRRAPADARVAAAGLGPAGVGVGVGVGVDVGAGVDVGVRVGVDVGSRPDAGGAGR